MKRISIFFITLIVVSFQNLIAQTDSLRISWNPNPEADMLEYRVYRSVNSTTNFQVIQTIPHPQVQTVDRNSIQPGNLYAFRLTAVDAAGNQSVPSEIVSVGIPQLVWTVTQIPSGSPTTVPLSSFINDPDNTAGEMAITISNQNNVTAVVNGSNLVLTPNPLAYVGSAGFTIRIEDPDGFWDIANVQLNINLVTNQSPVVSNIPNQTIAEGQNFTTISLDNYVADPDNADNQITWTYSGNTALNVSISSARVATITVANANWNGSETITFTATDPGGLSDNDPATFTVTAVNDPPVVSNIPNQTVSEGNLFANISLDNYVADPDNADNQITWTYSGNTALNVSISSARVATITVPNANWNGSETITFTATDPGGLWDNDPATFTVTGVNDPPRITSNAVTGATQGQLYQYQMTAIDPDPGDVLTYSLITSPGFLSINTSTGLISGTPAITDTGAHSVGVRVNDLAGASDTQNYTLTVLYFNDPPVVSDIPDQTVSEGNSFATISLDNYVADPDNQDDEITWTYSGNTGLNVSISPARLVTITVANTNWNGSETITFTATDPGGLSDHDPATFTVTGINDPPVVSNIPNQTILEGQDFATISLDNYVADPDNPDNQITWTFSGNTALDVSISPARVATITVPNTNWTGSETITFTATDPDGLSDSDPATFTVTAENDPPVVADIPDQSISEGDNFSMIQLDNYVTDPDNQDDEITWSYSGNVTLNVTISPTRVATITVPNANWDGSETITFTATDPGGLLASDPAIFTVTHVNDPPVINLSQLILQGVSSEVFDLKPFATDSESTVYELSWQFFSYSHFDFTWEDEPNKIIRIENLDGITNENGYFVVSDPEGASDTSLVALYYNADTTDTGPSLTLVPNRINFKEDFSLYLRLDTLCYDVNNSFSDLTFNFYPGDFVHYKYNSSTSLLEIFTDPNWFGDSDFRIDVADPEGYTASRTMNLKVEPVCDLDYIQIIPTAQNQVNVEIDTDAPSSVEMSFWVTPFLKTTFKTANFAEKHTFSLKDLIADTTYSYALTLHDTSGIEMLYSDSTFRTIYQITPAEDLAEVYVFPNPYRPSRGHNVVVFDNIPAEAKDLAIFSLTGDLVYERVFNGLPQRRVPWNVINNNGEKLASGFYIYVVKGEKGQKIKSGKIAVIR